MIFSMTIEITLPKHRPWTQHSGGKGAAFKSLPGFDNTHAPCLLVNTSSHVTPRTELRDRIVCERTKNDIERQHRPGVDIGVMTTEVIWLDLKMVFFFVDIDVTELVWPSELLMSGPRTGPFEGISTLAALATAPKQLAAGNRRTFFVSLNLLDRFLATATPGLTFPTGILL